VANATLTLQYCLPFTDICRPMADWAVWWQALGIISALLFGAAGFYKIIVELRRLNETRQKEIEDRDIAARLKRTEFFLDQHRRLFDNEALYSVLCLIDDDNDALAKPEMSDKKRKLLTFFEEIALLVGSKQIDEHVAYYMFGYYANCVKNGKNFAHGIDLSPQHWALFYKFADNARLFLATHVNGPEELSL
jgi:hypothetical protein